MVMIEAGLWKTSGPHAFVAAPNPRKVGKPGTRTESAATGAKMAEASGLVGEGGGVDLSRRPGSGILAVNRWETLLGAPSVFKQEASRGLTPRHSIPSPAEVASPPRPRWSSPDVAAPRS
jgi:hypothetical protein